MVIAWAAILALVPFCSKVFKKRGGMDLPGSCGPPVTKDRGMISLFRGASQGSAFLSLRNGQERI